MKDSDLKGSVTVRCPLILLVIVKKTMIRLWPALVTVKVKTCLRHGLVIDRTCQTSDTVRQIQNCGTDSSLLHSDNTLIHSGSFIYETELQLKISVRYLVYIDTHSYQKLDIYIGSTAYRVTDSSLVSGLSVYVSVIGFQHKGWFLVIDDGRIDKDIGLSYYVLVDVKNISKYGC